MYQIPDALNPEFPLDASSFFNSKWRSIFGMTTWNLQRADPAMVAALHAPTSKVWEQSIWYPFLGDPVNGIDPSESITCQRLSEY